MKVSVTIATWKRADLLDMVLDALVTQTTDHSKFEIIVCDSNSGEDTDSVVSKYKVMCPSLTIKHVHTENILAAKRNVGVKFASNEIVIFLDDDCVPESRFVEKYISHFERLGNAKIVLCGEIKYPPDWVAVSNYFRFRNSRHFGSGRRPELESGTLDCRTIVVMNMGFVKSEYIKSNLFVNEKFVGYGCEDHDLGYRINLAGFEILPTDISVEHRETSGSLIGYKKKLFHTSRDGIATLLQENPAVVQALGMNVLEAPQSVWYGALLTTLLKSPIVKLVEYFLEVTDNISLLYFPFGYKMVLASAYLEGKRSRSSRLAKKSIAGGWYQ